MSEEGHNVFLNVYDLSQGLAGQLSTTFLGKAIEGIWHTGVVVYGNEYYFGGGIQHSPTGATPYGTPIKVVDLGITHVPKDVFEMYLQEISPRYTAEKYSLLTHNCNNFSNEIAQFLVGVTIPEYILNLPNEVMSSPMGALILPMIQQLETTLRSGAVPRAPQFRPQTPFQTSQRSSTFNKSLAKESNSTSKELNWKEGDGRVESKEPSAKLEGQLKPENTVPAVEDPLGNARSKVQEEISAEFAALMATGTLRASEAAALATRRVMQRYGQINAAQS